VHIYNHNNVKDDDLEYFYALIVVMDRPSESINSLKFVADKVCFMNKVSEISYFLTMSVRDRYACSSDR